MRAARLLPYVPALLWAALLFFLSSRPSLPPLFADVPQSDKGVHACVYAVLAALLLRGARWPRGVQAWWAACSASVYGISDELHQYFVPGRSCDVFDWVADTTGACLCVGLWLRLHPWLHTRLQARGSTAA